MATKLPPIAARFKTYGSRRAPSTLKMWCFCNQVNRTVFSGASAINPNRKKREQSSAKVLTKEPLGLCLERCFQTKHQTTRGPYSALETISISPELQQGANGAKFETMFHRYKAIVGSAMRTRSTLIERMTSAGWIGQTAEACEALGVSRSTLYRRRRPVTSKPKRRPRPQRALDTTERERVLSALHCERFVDKAPAQVWATLLDEGIYHCSIRTMYRILSEHGEVRERRNQLRHPNYQKPELVAEAPNQVWSWDITKLRGPVKWTYFYLYVILDIFSRYVTGWMLARRESAELARRLISESCLKQNIEADQLTIHADRGSSMRSKSVALLLAEPLVFFSSITS